MSEFVNRCPFGHDGCAYIKPLCSPDNYEDKERFKNGYTCTASGREVKWSEVCYESGHEGDIWHAYVRLKNPDGCRCTMNIGKYISWNSKCAYGSGCYTYESEEKE